jgi:hypothetical protein
MTMNISKYEFQSDKFVRTMEVPLRNTMLEVVCANLSVSHQSVIIVELGGIAPKSLRSEGEEGKALLAEKMVELAKTSQDLADNGLIIEGIQYQLLQATSGAKQSASMLLSSDERLVQYFKALMTHPSKSYEQLMMGYQLPLTPNKALITAKLRVLIVDDEFDNYQVHGGSISQCIGADESGNPKWEVISTWEDQTIKHYDTRQAVGGVGDCHIKISQGLADYLANKVTGFNSMTGKPMTFLDSADQGCQFRLMVAECPAMAKGTFVVEPSLAEDYHMIIPKSAFKLGYPNLPTFDGIYTVTLGATMQAVDGRTWFGSQFCRSMSKRVLESRKEVIKFEMQELNEAGSSIEAAAKYFNADTLSTMTWFEEGEDGEIVESSRDDWFYKAMDVIAKSDKLDWALKDPTIVNRIIESIAKKKMRLALGMGFQGDVTTSLPDDNLPLHVIKSTHARRVFWRDGNWYIKAPRGKEILCSNGAVGMVECQGKQYIGMLVVRGKAPIMNHAEQCLAVRVFDKEIVGSGCDWMSHQSASVCTMDFDGDRNSVFQWRPYSDGECDSYLEVINHFVKLQRHCKIGTVAKEKSKVERRWGELTKLVYESAFEMGCSGITSMYCQATEATTIKGFIYWLGAIAILTGATQLYLDCQKYAPTNPEELKAIIDGAMEFYQAWQTDQRCKDLKSMPYIHRGLFTSKVVGFGDKAETKHDVGTIAACINYVNSLHEVPALLQGMKPLSHLKGIWGDYSAHDKQVAIDFKASLRAFDALCKEGDADSKKVSALIEDARVRCAEFTTAQFSAFWDLSYNKDCLIEIGQDGKEYIPTANKPWMLFTQRILENTPELVLKKERVFFKSVSADLKVPMLDRVRKGSFKTVLEVSPEFVVFNEKKGAIEMFPVISVKRGTVIGYVGTHVVPDIYEVQVMPATGIDRRTGESIVYSSCFDMRIIDIDF